MSILRYEQTSDPVATEELPSTAVAIASLLGILSLTLLVGVIGGVVFVSAASGIADKVALTALTILPFACQGATLGWVVWPMWQRCRRSSSVAAAATLVLGLLLVGCWLVLEGSLLWATIKATSPD